MRLSSYLVLSRTLNLAGRRMTSLPMNPVRPLSRLAYPLLEKLSIKRPFVRGVDIDGNTLFVSLLDFSVGLSLLTTRKWEVLTTKLFMEQLRPGMTVLDIGAQVGYFTLLAARCVGAEGKVFAIEPDQRHVALLRKNVQFNGIKNVVVVPKGASDQTGRFRLPVNGWSPAIPMETVRLDQLFNGDPSRVDFIKMDIDGGEIRALDGMRELVERSERLQMLVEYDPWQHRKSEHAATELLEHLQGLGFHLRAVLDEQRQEIRSMEWRDVRELRESVNLWIARE